MLDHGIKNGDVTEISQVVFDNIIIECVCIIITRYSYRIRFFSLNRQHTREIVGQGWWPMATDGRKEKKHDVLFVYFCLLETSVAPFFMWVCVWGGGGVSLFLELEIVDLSSGLLRNDAVLVALVDTVGLRLLLLLHLLN